jgi:hypothetical protein
VGDARRGHRRSAVKGKVDGKHREAWVYREPLDASGTIKEMAISPRMLAVLQKVDAAREEFLAGLRESARREAKAKARAKTLAKTRSRKPAAKDQE